MNNIDREDLQAYRFAKENELIAKKTGNLPDFHGFDDSWIFPENKKGE